MFFRWPFHSKMRDLTPGQRQVMSLSGTHVVLGTSMMPPFPVGCREMLLGMGCFWGAERFLWCLPGVFTTAVGYAGGAVSDPTYQEVCGGHTGHSEVVRVVFDPAILTPESLLAQFWEAHDPTQGMRQGNDVGTQYRSVVYVDRDEWIPLVEASREVYQQAIKASGRQRVITTEISARVPFYYAEEYHQQYLAKNPDGYCGLRGLGVGYSCASP
jgi:peptide-methionine (S)-S-oxide reductase